MYMEDKEKYIGVMDSGIGGLTVLKQLLNIRPQEKYLYFGDTKNLPYGEKSKEELIKIVKEIFDFFETQNVKAVVLACNTSSATAYEELKDNYSFKIYPLIQVVSKCVTLDKNLKRIGIMATQATVDSKKYTQELKKGNPDIEVFEQACPMWVPIIEKKLTDYDKNTTITQYLDKVLEFNPQKIILGCTHYPYLLDKLSKYADENLFINPAKIFAQYIIEDLRHKNLLSEQNNGYVKYFASHNPQEFEKTAEIFLKLKSHPELVEL